MKNYLFHFCANEVAYMQIFEQNKKKSIVNENLEKTPNQVLIQLSYLGSSLCYWR